MAGEKAERKTAETPQKIIERAIASGALTRKEAERSRVLLERGYLPIMGGAGERDWEKVAQLTGKAGELVREFRGTTSTRKRKKLANELNALIGEEEERWDERIRWQAQTAHHYMTGEIQEAERRRKEEGERGRRKERRGMRRETREGGPPREPLPPLEAEPAPGGRRPRVAVYLGMLPELRRRVTARYEEVEAEIDEESGVTAVVPDFDEMTDPDQVLLVVLETLNSAVAKLTERFDLLENRILTLGEIRMRKLIGPNDPRYTDLVALISHCRNFQSFVYKVWLPNRGGREVEMKKILSESGELMDNDLLWFFSEDPEVDRAFHEIKGVVGVAHDFIRGARHRFKDPNTGEESTVVVRGHEYGAAEKIGHFLRWVTGWGFYDGYGACAINAYMAHKIRWFPEYALGTEAAGGGKGWYEGLKPLMFEETEDGEVVLHTLCGWPSLWHAPNKMTDEWLRYLEGDQLEADNLSWEDKARLMIRYGKSDFRDWTYTREELEEPLRYRDQLRYGRTFAERLARQRQFLGGFMGRDQIRDLENEGLIGRENLTSEERTLLTERLRKAMFERAKETWRGLSHEQRRKIVRNTLLSDRWLRSFDLEARKGEFGVKPVIDLDSKNERGEYRISLADILHGEAGNWMNNFFTYEGYAVSTEGVFEQLSTEDPKALEELLENILKLLHAQEAFRHLYGELDEKTGERKGLLEKYYEETGWYMDAISRLLFLGPYLRRMKGQRVDEVAVPINRYLRIGLYRGHYAQEFVDVGEPGHDWTNLDRNPIRRFEGRVAKILGKFACRWEAWVNYMDGVLEGTPYANLTDQEKFWALVAYARFRIRPNQKGNFDGYLELRERIEHEGRVVQPGRVVRYFEFDLDRGREWGRQMFAEKLGEEGFEALMKVVDDRIKKSGMFNRFYEKMDEEDIICRLTDQYYDKDYNLDPRNHIKRDWGLPMSWYKREVHFNQALRDMKYTIGKFRDQFVLEQLETDPRQKVRDRRTIDGRIVELEAYNVVLKPSEVKDFRGRVLARVYQPVFPMFHYQRPEYCQGKDLVWSMLQGTGEWFPGMAKRLTPLYIHYNRDRYMNLFITLFFDPLFRRKAFENSGKSWDDDMAFMFVANPLKQRQILDMLESLEADPDWAQNWRGKLDIVSAEQIAEFTRERREIRVLDAEKGQVSPSASEEDIVALREMTLTGFKLIEPTGILASPLGKVFGRTGKEFVQRVWAMAPGAATSFIIFGLPTIMAPMAPGAGPIAITLRALVGVGSAFVGGLVSGGIIGGDAGVDPETGLEKEAYDRTFLGTVRRAWKIQHIGAPFSLMAARIEARSYKELAHGKRPEWDDIVPAENLVKVLFENPKAKLQIYQVKT